MVALCVALGGCGTGPASPAAPAPGPDPACAEFLRYGDLSGSTVDIAETAPDPEPGTATPTAPPTATPSTATPTPTSNGPRIAAYSGFERCTGVRIRHRVVASIAEQATAGPPPDLGHVPDAAALAELVRTNATVKPAPPQVAANVAEFYPETYRAAGSVDGTLYAAPLDATVTSLVRYSPRIFAERGYAVPTSWETLLELSQRIVADGGVPWCAEAGPGDGTGTGGLLVNSLEDALLGTAGPELFDAWVEHRIPTDAPQVVAALDGLAPILRGPVSGSPATGSPVTGSSGEPASATSTPGPAGGSPITSGSCLLSRQSDSDVGHRPAGAAAADGDVFAFRLPARNPDIGSTAVVGGGFVIAFSDRREVQAVAAYLSTPEWANAMAREREGGWLSPNSGVDRAAAADPIDRLALEVLQDPRVTLRYDGSDRMPAAVGAQALPQALTAWSTGTPAATALAAAEASWPR